MAADGQSRRSVLAGAMALSTSHLVSGEPLPNDPACWTLGMASTALAQRKISSVELTSACLKRIARHDPALNAFITRTESQALKDAKRSDERRASWRTLGPLDGIPVALKDNIDTAGIRTTAASRVFNDRVPHEDAEVSRRLKNAGAVLLGKLNLDEFAFEGTGTTGCYGVVKNPWRLDRITGGSSAGSAAAVAARLCFASVGSDDGGSVRIPGAYCGVVGFKTTYGRVSTRGVIPSAYSLDTIGPITRTVTDAALLLATLAGFDPLDSITADVSVPDYVRACSQPIADCRVGVPRDYFFEQLHPDVARQIERVIDGLRPKVKSMVEVKLPRFAFIPQGDYNVELYHYQKQFFNPHPELYHAWSRDLLNRMRTVEAVPYIETLKRIRECRRQIRETFNDVDVLVLPTMRDPAPTIDGIVNRTHKRLPSNTSAFNRFGVPAMTIPCGLSHDGLPIGCQIVAAAWGEARVLSVARVVEQFASTNLAAGPSQFKA